jgi:anthranilate phosphoribosyltransferase
MTGQGWPDVLSTLTARRDLTAAQTAWAMGEILAGAASPSLIAGFAVALRTKGETTEELAGCVDAMYDHAVPLDLDGRWLDVVGTGGDRSFSVNISTMASVVAAGAGAKVAKHGNRSASSKSGSADVLEALGVRLDLRPDEVVELGRQVGITFAFAPAFHPALRHAAVPRRELGIGTTFNFLGPLANPARVKRQLTGVADGAMADRMVRVLAANGTERALVVYGHDGLDELSTITTSTVLELRDGDVRSYDVDPGALGLKPATLQDIQGGDPPTNADLARRVLDGEPGAKREFVLLNAAAGLVAAGMAEDLAEGLAAATASVDEGRAAAVLERLVTVSNQGA